MRPHRGQLYLRDCLKRFPVVPAGRGSGKTEIAKRKLVMSLRPDYWRLFDIKKSWSDPRYFYAAPTRDQVKRIAWRDFKALIPGHWIADKSDGELRIQTVWGSELWVVGMDKPQRIEGLQWDGGVLDECSDLKPEAFALTVLPMLTHRDGFCWRIGVPKRYGIGAREYKKAFEDASDYNQETVKNQKIQDVRFTWPSSDILTPEQLEYHKARMPEKDFEEQFDAKWQTAGGAVYYSFTREFNMRPCAYDPSRPICVGSDFNVNPMCWVLGHVYDANRVEIFSELFLRDANTQAALNSLWERYHAHAGGWEFYGDASGKARHTSATAAAPSDLKIMHKDERFSSAGRTFHYPASNPNVVDRFAATNAALCNAAGERRLFIDPSCVHLIQDLEMRAYKPGTRDVNDFGDQGHMADACDYIIFARFPIRLNLNYGVAQVYAHAGPE